MVSIEVCSAIGRPSTSEDERTRSYEDMKSLLGYNAGSCFVDSGLIYTAVARRPDMPWLHRVKALPLAIQRLVKPEDGPAPCPRPLIKDPEFLRISSIPVIRTQEILPFWWPRFGARTAVIGDCIYCYGPHFTHYRPRRNIIPNGDPDKYMSPVFRYNLKQLRWQTICTEGHPPAYRENFGMAAVGSKLFIFGGLRYRVPAVEQVPDVRELDWNNEVHVLDTGPFESRGVCARSEMRYQGSAPAPRSDPATTVGRGQRDGVSLYVFGGSFQDNSGNDIHRLDLDTATWSGELDVRGSIPCERAWATLSAASDSRLVMCGGYGSNHGTLNDVYLFDTNVLTWFQLDTSHIPGGLEMRRCHNACVDQDYADVYILGGIREFPCSYCTTSFTLIASAGGPTSAPSPFRFASSMTGARSASLAAAAAAAASSSCCCLRTRSRCLASRMRATVFSTTTKMSSPDTPSSSSLRCAARASSASAAAFRSGDVVPDWTYAANSSSVTSDAVSTNQRSPRSDDTLASLEAVLVRGRTWRKSRTERSACFSLPPVAIVKRAKQQR